MSSIIDKWMSFVAGEDSYQEWTKDPSIAQLVSAWKQIYGKTFIQEVS